MVKPLTKNDIKDALGEFIHNGGFDEPIQAYTKKTIQDMFSVIDLPVETAEERKRARGLISFVRRIKKRCDIFYDNIWKGVALISVSGFFGGLVWAATTYLGK